VGDELRVLGTDVEIAALTEIGIRLTGGGWEGNCRRSDRDRVQLSVPGFVQRGGFDLDGLWRKMPVPASRAPSRITVTWRRELVALA
jgi:hypothetical protein